MNKNKKYINSKIAEHGFKIGCYHEDLEKLSNEQLDKVIDHLDTGDVVVYLNEEKFVVEKYIVLDELDLSLISAEDYELLYGREVHKNY